MNIRNCRGCGRIFNYVVGPVLCQQCRDELEKKFQSVKDYIRENPGASITDVALECDVTSAQIQQWLRSERLEVTEDSSIFLNCENCGANIRSGKFCDKCKNQIASGLKDAIKSQEPVSEAKKLVKDTSSKMRYL